MPLFGKKKDPKEQVKEWKQQLRKEQRGIDRQIRSIQREEAKVAKSIKDAAKGGNVDVAKILAKELIQSRKAVSKMYASKAQMNSVTMSMDHQLAMVRMSGSMEKSTDVMKAMNKLTSIPELQQTMMALSREMTQAGIMEEMMADTFESLEDDDLEEEADEAVEAILFEVTSGQLGKAGSVPTKHLATQEVVADEEDEEDEEEMRRRLAQLQTDPS